MTQNSKSKGFNLKYNYIKVDTDVKKSNKTKIGCWSKIDTNVKCMKEDRQQFFGQTQA